MTMSQFKICKSQKWVVERYLIVKQWQKLFLLSFGI